MSRRVLTLTLKARWFELIASGQKRQEFRALTRHWKPRIEGREYDEILFRHGYSRDAATVRVEYKGWRIGESDDGNPSYVLDLGRILEVKPGSGR